MTHAERQALREKHRSGTNEAEFQCQSCYDDWPCDVIKVLDYLDVVEPMPQQDSGPQINWKGGK